MRSETSIRTQSGSVPAAKDLIGFPYLLTRLEIDHLMPLPEEKSVNLLREMARRQAQINRLPTWLVIGADLSVYFDQDGQEVLSTKLPSWVIVTAGRLQATPTIQTDPELKHRRRLFIRHTDTVLHGCARQTAALGIGNIARWAVKLLSNGFDGSVYYCFVQHDGHQASAKELARFSERQVFGVPNGLTRCHVCLEWRGESLGTEGLFQERVLRVHCRCENDNRCANCGECLAARKLKSYFYDEAKGAICYFPGYWAYTHSCSETLEAES